MGFVGWSDYLLNAGLKHIHNEATFTEPDSYLAAFIGNPLAAGVEVTGGSYARQTVTWNGVAAGVNEYTDENTGEIAFPEATGDWGSISHVATFDALTVGNMLEVFELSTARNVVTGIVLKVKDGEIDSYVKRESI
ncbi:MAG: hypothetical protein JRC90_09895 [Deltaproteobacteria bacterium]|nr:hypothetical protein [Deltaproteobacteria bacterium]